MLFSCSKVTQCISLLQAETYYYLGITYDDQGKYREGLDAYLKASKIDLTIAGKDTWKLEKQVIKKEMFPWNFT